MKTLIKNGHIWNGEEFEKLDVLLGNHDILEVAPTIDDTSADKICDAENKYVLPGVVDAHVHLNQNGGPAPTLPLEHMNIHDIVLEEAKNCRTLLKSGVTSFRECGATEDEMVSLRNAINAGKLHGPTMVCCNRPIKVVGGHYAGNTPTGPIEMRQEARQLVGEGVDFLKLMVTGGLSGNGVRSENPFCLDMTQDEIDAVVEIAKMHDMFTGAHCHTKESMIMAMKAGVDIIEHATFMDDEVIDMILATDSWVCPTFSCYEQIAAHGTKDGISEETVRQVVDIILPAKRASFKKAYDRGVKFCFGRDSGSFFSLHDDYPAELKFMENAGMSRKDCIKSCTENSSKAIRLWKYTGSIEAGKWADIVILNSNPLDDLDAYRDLYKVFKFGRTVEDILLDK